jgi:hypothetical protein
VHDGLPQGAPRTTDLASWCWEHADNTGDARYCGLARSLETIAEVWDDDGYLRNGTYEALNATFKRHLVSVLDAPTAEEGTHLAKLLREELYEVLGSRRN